MIGITDKHTDANRHQTIQFGHYHWTLSLVMIIALYGMSKKVKLKSVETMRIPCLCTIEKCLQLKKASKTKSLKTPEGEGRAPKKGKKGKNESDNVQSKGTRRRGHLW